MLQQPGIDVDERGPPEAGEHARVERVVEVQQEVRPAEDGLGHGRLDADDRLLLERNGWRVRHSTEVAATPEAYRAYVQQSRGEFSCAKPSCMAFQNAWVSDRTLCYLASGKPVVVQHTGPSRFLPDGEGMFRFSTLDEAAAALATIEASYARQCRAAREIAEELFDAKRVLAQILDLVDDETVAERAGRAVRA